MTATTSDAKMTERRLDGRYAPSIVVIHLIALLALVPWLFSWTGFLLMIAGCYLFGTLGINLGYHRLITHRGLTCPRWLEYSFAFLGVCCMQDAPAHWAAIHRCHHQFSDEEPDPHSPIVSFFWAHMGWLMTRAGDLKRGPLTNRYSKDLTRQPFYRWLERHDNWMKVAAASWAVYFVAGFGAIALFGGSWLDAVQFGLSLVVWGAALRTVLVWHITWSINSVTHVWGYRNYQTPDTSRNSLLIALISNGEGWHNNHHADPRSARHGHLPGEFDLTWLTIRLLMILGLAKNVATPSPILAAKFNFAGARPRPAGADEFARPSSTSPSR